LTIEPLKPEDFTKAVELMEDYKLDYEDSIHLAVATRTGAQEILSNDEDFDVAPIKRNM
jgi:predicted nucleic acid-binding protein